MWPLKQTRQTTDQTTLRWARTLTWSKMQSHFKCFSTSPCILLWSQRPTIDVPSPPSIKQRRQHSTTREEPNPINRHKTKSTTTQLPTSEPNNKARSDDIDERRRTVSSTKWRRTVSLWLWTSFRPTRERTTSRWKASHIFSRSMMLCKVYYQISFLLLPHTKTLYR